MSEIVVGDADFGDVVHTDSRIVRFNLTNSGQVNATLVVEGGLAAPYSFAGGFPGGVGGAFCPNTGTIPPGTCEIEVTFNPTDVGLGPVVYPDDISISYFDGSALAGPALFSLTGRGLDKATLVITPNPHDYGNVAVGGIATQTFTVTNSGDVQGSNLADAGFTLPLNYIWANGTYPGHARGTACALNLAGVSGTNTCELDVSFDPQLPVDINKDGAINLTYDDGLAIGVATNADLDGVPKNPALLQVTSHGAGPFDFTFHPNGSDTDEVFTVTNNGDFCSKC